LVRAGGVYAARVVPPLYVVALGSVGLCTHRERCLGEDASVAPSGSLQRHASHLPIIGHKGVTRVVVAFEHVAPLAAPLAGIGDV
jgi:hypothetical protein